MEEYGMLPQSEHYHEPLTPSRKSVVFFPQTPPPVETPTTPSENGEGSEAQAQGGEDTPIHFSYSRQGSMDTTRMEGLIQRKQISMFKLYAMAAERGMLTANACEKSAEARQSLAALLSGIYGLFLVILALAFEISRFMSDSSGDHSKQEAAKKFQGFYLYLYLAGLAFFAFCQLILFRDKTWSLRDFSCRRNSMEERQREMIAEQLAKKRGSNRFGDALSLKRKVTYSGPTAGSLYLRLGCIFFGLCGIIFYGLKCYEQFVSGHPEVLTVTTSFFGCFFVFMQMIFVFQNSKLTIHRFRLVCRFGTMHLVATNICVWIRFFLLEVVHTMHEYNENVLTGHSENVEDLHSRHHRAAGFSHHNYQTANESKSLHAIAEHDTGSNHHQINCTSTVFSLACHVKNFQPFLITSIVEFSIICAAVMFILWRNIDQRPSTNAKNRKENFRVDCSSSSKGLFLGLFVIIFAVLSMVVFTVRIHLPNALDSLWILYTSFAILYISAIKATLFGGYRMLRMSYVSFHKGLGVLLLDDILLFIGFVGQMLYCVFSVVLLDIRSPISVMLMLVNFIRVIQVTTQTIFILCAQRLVALTPYLQRIKPGRQMVTFLLITNLTLFFINIFETHKASVHPAMKDFYGEAVVFNILVHSTVPLTIFYRFHSSVCLSEIWKTAYRERARGFEEGDVM